MNVLEQKDHFLRGSELPQPRTFTEFMCVFLTAHQAKIVVEVGSDPGLRLALRLAPSCQRFLSVNFFQDHQRMKGWQELHAEMGGVDNIELVSGNAVELSKMITQADVIILQNVLLALSDEDTGLMWQYRRKELECSEEEWDKLVSRFQKAEKKGYKEFLKVAKPGYIVTFRRPDPKNRFREFLEKTLGINPSRIEEKKLFYGDGSDQEELWTAYIVNNSY